MKKAFLIACLGMTVFSNAYADTEQPANTPSQEEVQITEYNDTIIFNDTVYVPQRQSSFADSRFFVGLQASLLSYDNYEITLDNYGTISSSKNLNFNSNIFDNQSFTFGLEINEDFRIFLGMSHHSEEYENSYELSATSYELGADVMLGNFKKVSPFVRFGIGFIGVEEDDNSYEYNELSAMAYMLGFGVNYNMSDNVFAYAALQYQFIPETEVDTGYDDSGVDIEVQALGFNIGIGYKF